MIATVNLQRILFVQTGGYILLPPRFEELNEF